MNPYSKTAHHDCLKCQIANAQKSRYGPTILLDIAQRSQGKNQHIAGISGIKMRTSIVLALTKLASLLGL